MAGPLTLPSRSMTGYLDSASAFVGDAGAVAVNQPMGGSLDSFDKAIDSFEALRKNPPVALNVHLEALLTVGREP